MNKNAFRAAMVYHNDTQSTTAEYLGISRVALSDKLNTKYDFRLDEIKMLCDRWQLTPQQLYDIFIEDSSDLSSPNDGANLKKSETMSGK